MHNTETIKLNNISVQHAITLIPIGYDTASLIKVDKNTNTIYLTGTSEEIKPIKKFLEEIDKPLLGKSYERFDVHYGDVANIVQLIPSELIKDSITIIPESNSFIALVSPEISTKIKEHLKLLDKSNTGIPVRLKYIKNEDLLKYLPPTIVKEDLIVSSDDTLVFYVGAEGKYNTFIENLKLIDVPKPQIRYELLIVQYQKGTSENFSKSLSVKPVTEEQSPSFAVAGMISNLLNINFDVVSKFGYQFAVNLSQEIGESRAKVLADTTLHGISGTDVKFQNTNTYRYNEGVLEDNSSVIVKTSTKEMIASVLQEKFKIAKTQGNYNNHIGVPLTILGWREDIEAAVVEMGMNHFGEISILTKIVKPTIAVITNIGTAHIGILGSRENILKAKLEILEGLNNKGKIVLNNDNDLLNNCDIKKYEKITYGIKNESNYIAENIKIKENGSRYEIKIENKKHEIKVPISGEHFIYNSLCAIAIGKELNIDIKKIICGIKKFEVTGKRNEIKEINNIKIINDYYNASYDSMKSSLEVLKEIKAKRKIAILGDMLELGEFSEELHRKVGKEVAKNNINILITVGNFSKKIAEEASNQGIKEVYKFNTNKECIENIKNIIKKEDCILLKASNAMNFEEISNYLQGDIIWKN